jgi:hypothetical protein
MSTKWKKKRRTKKMDAENAENVETPTEVVKEKVDIPNDVKMTITRPPGANVLQIYIRAPMVAKIVRQMANSNYEKAKYAPIYKGILQDYPEEVAVAKGRVVTKKAITQATKNFVGGTDFNFNEAPRAILLANADILEQGYTLEYTVETPVPMEQIKRWGKQFMDGCKEIIAGAKPYKMSWVMNKE